jgi:lipoprotein-anchoring transpeptidase ErfK/SrfK
MTRSRAALATALALACAGTGVLAAATLAAGATRDDPSPTDTTATTETGTTSTDTTTVTTVAAVIPEGVTVAGVAVGGLSPDAAASALGDAFAAPVPIVSTVFRVELDPARVGAAASIAKAVDAALHAAPGTALPLAVRVPVARVHRFVAALAKRYDRKPADSVVVLRHQRPWVSPGHPGRTLERLAVERALLADLRGNHRAAVRLTGTTQPQHVTRKSFGPVIVIRRASNKLTLYNGMRYARQFGVATGQPRYPTPLGRFTIVVMWRNPWWYPPNAPWAQGEKPTPPGPGNPLGTRWMGLSSPGVGIHGTPQPQSIGYSLSHGCIRMRIPEAEWLFQHVRVGATVFIIPA